MKSVEKRCSACKQLKPRRAFSTTPRTADGYSGRCKLCTCEESKASIRYLKKLPGFETEIVTWPDVKILSEVKWLEAKLKALRTEMKGRRSSNLMEWREIGPDTYLSTSTEAVVFFHHADGPWRILSVHHGDVGPFETKEQAMACAEKLNTSCPKKADN